ncbi:MAG: hypothetical protein AAF922_04470 [Pseudomonadota bacterium]
MQAAATIRWVASKTSWVLLRRYDDGQTPNAVTDTGGPDAISAADGKDTEYCGATVTRDGGSSTDDMLNLALTTEDNIAVAAGGELNELVYYVDDHVRNDALVFFSISLSGTEFGIVSAEIIVRLSIASLSEGVATLFKARANTRVCRLAIRSTTVMKMTSSLVIMAMT